MRESQTGGQIESCFNYTGDGPQSRIMSLTDLEKNWGVNLGDVQEEELK